MLNELNFYTILLPGYSGQWVYIVHEDSQRAITMQNSASQLLQKGSYMMLSDTSSKVQRWSFGLCC